MAASAAIAVVPPASGPASLPILITPPRAIGITRYMAFGDSITWGAYSAWEGRFLAAANGGYPERLQAALTSRHSPQQFVVFNDGSPGEFAVNALMRFRTSLTTRQPQTVLLLEGINDLGNDVPPAQVAAGVFRMVDAAAALGIPVGVATMYQTYAVTDPDGHYRHNGAAAVPAFNAELRRLAQGRLNVHLVDLEPTMGNRSLVGADGVHLTDEGFNAVTAAFLQRIEAAFPVRGSVQ